MSVHPNEYQRIAVTYACEYLKSRNIAYNASPGGWEVQTPIGPRSARTGWDLVRLVESIRKGTVS
jgi:hypothetical protein